MKGFYTIILLIFSNIFMTFAWYGHLKLQEMKVTTHWPLIAIILLSWGMVYHSLLPRRKPPLEPSRRRRMPCPCRLFRLYEIRRHAIIMQVPFDKHFQDAFHLHPIAPQI